MDMTKVTRAINRDSISIKQMLVRAVESGYGITATPGKFDVKGSETIQNWLGLYGKNHLYYKILGIETMGEIDQIKELQKQLKEAKVPWVVTSPLIC